MSTLRLAGIALGVAGCLLCLTATGQSTYQPEHLERAKALHVLCFWVDARLHVYDGSQFRYQGVSY